MLNHAPSFLFLQPALLRRTADFGGLPGGGLVEGIAQKFGEAFDGEVAVGDLAPAGLG